MRGAHCGRAALPGGGTAGCLGPTVTMAELLADLFAERTEDAA
ncbi:hypothetical protein OG422_11615 [Streptomyces sp. NBC_01525]|nr:hypothetical protein [Streptomyces benahoarensis]